MMSKQIVSNLFLCLMGGWFCMGLSGCGAGVQSGRVEALHYTMDPNSTIYDFSLKDINGWTIALSKYEGKILLVVNVASECRYTYQYQTCSGSI